MSHKQRPEYLQLQANEDIYSLRDRLSFIRGKRVLLIWPEEGTALTRKLDLVLVQREARRRAIQLALVTHDEQVINHARELRISTFETINDSQRKRWERGRTRVFIQRHHKPKDEPEPEDLMSVASRVRRSRKRISQLRYAVERLIILAALLAIVVGAAYVLLPTATIRLNVNQTIVSAEVTLIADPQAREVDVDNRIIPATTLTATVQTVRSIPTTGLQSLDDLPASGDVVFTNRTGSVVDIPEGTLISTSAGTPIRFRTVVAARVPAGSGEQVSVAIEAAPDAYGELGNVEAGLINRVTGELAERLDVVNLAATSGGQSRQFQAVAQADIDRLFRLVSGELQRLAYEEMQATLTESQQIVVETIFIPESGLRDDWITYSHQQGDLSDVLSLDMRAVVQATAIDDRFARQIVFASLSAQKPRELILLPDTYIFTRGSVNNIDERDRVTLTALGEAVATARVDTSLLRNQIIAMVPTDAAAYISQQTALLPGSQPLIDLAPPWLPRLPILPTRIEIVVENGS